MSDGAGVFFVEALLYGGAIWIVSVINKQANQAKQEKVDKNNNAATNAIQSLNFNTNNNSVVQFANETFSIILSNEAKQFVIITNGYNQDTYSYDNLVNVEVKLDENVVSSPSIGGAIVGGVLFGGAGAIIGSSNKTAEKKVKKVILRITVDDIKKPIHDLHFFSNELAFPLENPLVKTALENANNWYGRFVTIVEKRKINQPNGNSNNLSVADEISKLKKLMDDGVITSEEFDASKKKLF